MTWRELGHELLPLDVVREKVLSLVPVLGTETCRLGECHGRVLRQRLVCSEPVPPFDNSAMDGFAVRSRELAGASAERPVRLVIAGKLQAGEAGGEDLDPGTALRIMTGAPLPRGADAVVPHELTASTATEVAFSQPVKAGQNVRRAGGDLAPGDVPLGSGCVLRPPQLAIAASLGCAELEVSRRPRVAVLSPGDELVDVREQPGPGKIRNSNAYAIAALLEEAGAEPLALGIIPDRKAEISAAIQRGLDLGADAFVSTGGVSAGDYDFVQAVVRDEARPGFVFKVAMRPGKPQVFGLFAGRPFFGLPGNPAAAILSFEVFVRPALRTMRGETAVLPTTFGVRFAAPYRYKPGRVFLLRTRLEPEPGAGGGWRVVDPGPQDSSFLASLARANAVVVLPAERDRVEAGEVHPAFWLGGERLWA